MAGKDNKQGVKEVRMQIVAKGNWYNKLHLT